MVQISNVRTVRAPRGTDKNIRQRERLSAFRSQGVNYSELLRRCAVAAARLNLCGTLPVK